MTLALLPAAALEELLFRSLPLGGLAWLIEPQWLMWPLALFFGLLHWPQGGWGVTGTTLAAIMLSLLFLATGSIWPPLATHYVMNVLQVAVAVRTGVRPLRTVGQIRNSCYNAAEFRTEARECPSQPFPSAPSPSSLPWQGWLIVLEPGNGKL